MLFRGSSSPPRSTRQRACAASNTRRESCPSSSSSSSPSAICSGTHGGTGKSSPSVISPPASSAMGCASAPMRTSGPCKSMISSLRTPSAAAAQCILFTHAPLSCSVPWERFSRIPHIPARNIARSVSGCAQAGPSVPYSFPVIVLPPRENGGRPMPPHRAAPRVQARPAPPRGWPSRF